MATHQRKSSSRKSIKSLPMAAVRSTSPTSATESDNSSNNRKGVDSEQQHSAVVLQEVAASLNNNAVRMFRERQYEDSLMLYKQSLALLNNANFLLETQDERTIRNGTFFAHKFTEVQDFNQPIEVPLNSTHMADVLMSNEEYVSAAIMYNLFLLLRATGRQEDAMSFLELVHSIVQPSSEEESNMNHEQKWHPSFRMVLQYHLGMFALECDEKESAWRLFIDAIAIGKQHIPHRMLYAKLCTKFGGLLMEEQNFAQAQAVFEEASMVYQRSCYAQGDKEDEESDIELSPENAFAAAAA